MYNCTRANTSPVADRGESEMKRKRKRRKRKKPKSTNPGSFPTSGISVGGLVAMREGALAL